MDVVHAGAATGSSPILVDALDKSKEKAGTTNPKTTVPRARTPRTTTILLPNCGGGRDCELHEFCAFVGWFAPLSVPGWFLGQSLLDSLARRLVVELLGICFLLFRFGRRCNCYDGRRNDGVSA